MKKVHKGVKGIILDYVYDTPIVGAIIRVEGINHTVTSYLTGDYWRILAPGKYKIVVEHQE